LFSGFGPAQIDAVLAVCEDVDEISNRSRLKPVRDR